MCVQEVCIYAVYIGMNNKLSKSLLLSLTRGANIYKTS